MYTQKLLVPAIQTATRSIAWGTSDLFQNARSFNQRDYNSSFNDAHLSQNSFGKFSMLFKKTEYGSFIKVVSRNFGKSSFHFIREFSSNSTENTHNILCSLPEYKSTTVHLTNSQQSGTTEISSQIINFVDQNQDITLDQLIKHFKIFSQIISNTDAMIDDENISYLLTSLINKCEALSYKQLLDILSSAKLWQVTMSNKTEFMDLLAKLEHFCSRNIKRWTLSQSLLIADYWYIINGSKRSSYFRRMQIIHGPYVKYFSDSQFVQYLFYAHAFKAGAAFKKADLLKKLKEAVPLLSIHELGIVSMALNGTDTRLLSSRIVFQFVQKLINEKETVPDEIIVVILKYLHNVDMSEKLAFSLLNAFLQQIHKHNCFVHMRFCQFASSKSLYHKEFMDKLLKQFCNNLPSLRLKDIERFTYAVMLFKTGQDTHQNILQLIVDELRKPERIIEFNHFPHIFVSCITHLTAAGIYPLDLISAVFQPSMLQYLKDIQNSCSYHDIFRSVNEICWALLIEGPPNYIGYQLDSTFRDELTKKYISRIPEENMADLQHNEIRILRLNSSLSTFLHLSSSIVNILPQFCSPDVVFCTNSEGDAVQVPDCYFHQCEVHAKIPMCIEAGIKWNAVIYARKSLMTKPNNQLKGNLIHKIRLLEKLGYVVSLAKPFPDNIGVEKKFNYFKETLSNSTLNVDKKILVIDESVQCNNEKDVQLAHS